MDYSSTQRLEAIMQLKLFESISCIAKVIPCGSPGSIKPTWSQYILAATLQSRQMSYAKMVKCILISCCFSQDYADTPLIFHLRFLSLFQAWQESGSRPKL